MVQPLLLTVEECASRLRVSRSTVYSALHAGSLRGYRVGRPGRRGCWRVAAHDLESWFHSLRAAARPGTPTPPAPPTPPPGGYKHLRL